MTHGPVGSPRSESTYFLLKFCVAPGLALLFSFQIQEFGSTELSHPIWQDLSKCVAKVFGCVLNTESVTPRHQYNTRSYSLSGNKIQNMIDFGITVPELEVGDADDLHRVAD